MEQRQEIDVYPLFMANMDMVDIIRSMKSIINYKKKTEAMLLNDLMDVSSVIDNMVIEEVSLDFLMEEDDELSGPLYVSCYKQLKITWVINKIKRIALKARTLKQPCFINIADALDAIYLNLTGTYKLCG